MSAAGQAAPRGASLVDTVRRRLAEAGLPSPDAEAWALVEAVTGRSRLALLTEPLHPSEAQRARLEAWIARRTRGEPLQHVLGRAPFWTFDVSSGPATLVPRPETEGLVAWALEELRGRRAPHVLDVGTGSGALALAVALERPDATVWATDVSHEALEAARRDARRLGAAVRFERADLLGGAPIQALLPHLDLVLANPPYLPEADQEAAPPEVRFDPATALYAGPDGLAVWRRLEREARAGLAPGATVLAELDPRNIGLAAGEARERWRDVRVRLDLAGRDRYLRLRL